MKFFIDFIVLAQIESYYNIAKSAIITKVSTWLAGVKDRLGNKQRKSKPTK